MKSLLIKLGKIGKAIEQDGLLVGGGRVIGYVKKYFKTILNFKSGQVLIVTGGVGDSALYRAGNMSEELNSHGIKTEVMIQDNPFLSIFANKFSVFVFQRTRVTSAVEKLVNNIKKQNKEIIYESDDLVFDAKYIQKTDHYKNMSPLEKKQYEKGVGEEILRDAYVKTCVTSTHFIAGKLEEYHKKVFVVTNKLSEEWRMIAEQLLQGRDGDEKNQGKVRIGYFSGTVGHNKDFATVSDALIEVLKKYSQVEIFIAGSLQLEEKFDAYSDRIVRSPYVSREKHFENISRCDIILAPLEIGDDFSEGKSELKFSESGILEIPVVAVRNQTFSGVIEDGVNGFLADHKEEWVEKLSRLIEDKNLRIQLGKQARETALRDYTTKNSHSEEYYAYLRSKIK